LGLRVDAITMDCNDMAKIRRFWAEALGHREVEGGVDWSWVEHPDGLRPRICIQKVPEGKIVKNRIHLDLRLGEDTTLDSERHRLERLGATALRLVGAEPGNRHYLMADPEGNEFCLVDGM
jgi:catechol 2,3-dioxygenase-like lactoylglutathione lyase family enzyme